MTTSASSREVAAPWLARISPKWQVVQLRRIAQVCNGEDSSGVETVDGPYDVYGSGGRFRRAGSYLYDGESVLFGRKGTINKPLYVAGRFWTVDTMFYTRLKCGVYGRYLYWYATTMPFSYYSTSTALPSVTQGQLLGHVMPLPPMEEQRAIAEYLDRETAQIDALIGKQEQLIERLHERRLAVAQSVVEPPRLTDSTKLKHCVSSVKQGWSPQCYGWSADGVQSWAVLKAGATNWGRFRPQENKAFPPTEVARPEAVVQAGQIVISRASTRDLVGSAAVVNGSYPRLMLSDKLYALEVDSVKAIPDYVALVLGTRVWRDLIELEATGSSPSMQNISLADILNLPMHLPSTSEQIRRLHTAAEGSAKVDALIAKAEQFIALARERRAALITAAVTGQIDVREAS